MKTSSKTTGLRYWMLRVLEECDRASAGFRADPVHDLRVALRRCRSMADGMMALDPDPAWKAMKKAGKELFRSLGDLRDTQITTEWIEKRAPTIVISTPAQPPLSADSPSNASPDVAEASADASADVPEQPRDAASALLVILHQRESEQKRAAEAALDHFDRKQWQQWSKSLPLRAARIRPGSAVFKHLALERWAAARELHTCAMRSRSQVALHTLRIGIKRFRYIVENFLPTEHKLWSNDLKHMQDLLGEVHDLDVLWATALSCRVFQNQQVRQAWHSRISEERTKRVDEYRSKMCGPESLWNLWWAGLPQGKRVQQIATQRMKLWASVLDPDFAHSERVAKLAVRLYDGLHAKGLLRRNRNAPETDNSSAEERSALYIAALLHDVGKARGKKGHHKESLDLIKSHPAPLGWGNAAMQKAAVIARFHAGALPSRSHKLLRDLLPEEQRSIIRSAAILRLANAFDAQHDGHIRRVQIENGLNGSRLRRVNGFRRASTPIGRNEAIAIGLEGYRTSSPTAQAIAAERHLLETVLRHPIIVKPIAGVS